MQEQWDGLATRDGIARVQGWDPDAGNTSAAGPSRGRKMRAACRGHTSTLMKQIGPWHTAATGLPAVYAVLMAAITAGSFGKSHLRRPASRKLGAEEPARRKGEAPRPQVETKQPPTPGKCRRSAMGDAHMTPKPPAKKMES
eukprot:scaffold3164_cov112-Isochrysis_galbana.AAC.4